MRVTVGTHMPAGISVGALWSLFWRAFVLTPLAIVFGGLYVAVWTLIFALPLLEIRYLWEGSWLMAVLAPNFWVALFLVTRSRWFSVDHHLFPNDQENV